MVLDSTARNSLFQTQWIKTKGCPNHAPTNLHISTTASMIDQQQQQRCQSAKINNILMDRTKLYPIRAIRNSRYSSSIKKINDKIIYSRQCRTAALFATTMPTPNDEDMDCPKPIRTNTTIRNTKKSIITFIDKNFFLLGMVFVIIIAKQFPSLGSNGSRIYPEIVIHQIGISIVFMLSGLSIEFQQLQNAITNNWKLNLLVQCIIFIIWPFCIGYPLYKVLTTYCTRLLPHPIVDGLFITTCLPTTINACIVLSRASGGNVATAICNSVISNIIGIIITPLLLLCTFFRFSRTSGHISTATAATTTTKLIMDIPFMDMIGKLCSKVLLPVTIGQILRKVPRIRTMYANQTKHFKRLQDIILLSIVWNAFCNSIVQQQQMTTTLDSMTVSHVILVIGMLLTIHVSVLAGLYQLFTKIFHYNRTESISAMFCSSHKTLAFGIPLLRTIFDDARLYPNLASYCIPIMFLHPIQLIIGSILAPSLAAAGESKSTTGSISSSTCITTTKTTT